MQAIYTANLAPVFMMERSYAFKLPNVSHALELAIADPSTPMTMCVNEGSANAVRGQKRVLEEGVLCGGLEEEAVLSGGLECSEKKF